MQLLGLHLQHFRRFTEKSIVFEQPVTLIVAPNTSGKTTLLEAMYMLARGESFRAEHVGEMIALGQEIARVKGKIIQGGADKRKVGRGESERLLEEVKRGESEENEEREENKEREETTLEVMLTHGSYQGNKVQARTFQVNGVKRLRKNFVSHLLCVLFRPEDLRLIDGSPERRRQFLDAALSQTDPYYMTALATYHNALIRRNRTLEQIRDSRAPRSILSYWTQLVLEHGQYLHQQRQKFIHFCAGVPFPEKFSITYLPSLLDDEKLLSYADREIAAGHTLIGPHKDDFVVSFQIEKSSSTVVPVSSYGSRGQERLAVLWLKMCELAWLERSSKEDKQNKQSERSEENEQGEQKVILLLDDILSELDQSHRAQVYTLFHNRQVIATTTDPAFVKEVKQELSKVTTMLL